MDSSKGDREDERSLSAGRTFDVDQFLNFEGDNGK